MSVNMTSLWELITEVTSNTESIIDLIILGIIITIAITIGKFIHDSITGEYVSKHKF